MNRVLVPLALSIACATAFTVQAQPASAPSTMAPSAADRGFVDEAGAGGAAEIALGRMATEKAARDDVKQLGQKMVDDHTQAGDELKRIAEGKGMTPPEAPKPAQQKAADKLSRLSGTSFDTAYLNQMVLDHQKTIALFRREARSGHDADLKAFAGKTLPALEDHLRMVRSLQTKGGPMNRAENETMPVQRPAMKP